MIPGITATRIIKVIVNDEVVTQYPSFDYNGVVGIYNNGFLRENNVVGIDSGELYSTHTVPMDQQFIRCNLQPTGSKYYSLSVFDTTVLIDSETGTGYNLLHEHLGKGGVVCRVSDADVADLWHFNRLNNELYLHHHQLKITDYYNEVFEEHIPIKMSNVVSLKIPGDFDYFGSHYINVTDQRNYVFITYVNQVNNSYDGYLVPFTGGQFGTPIELAYHNQGMWDSGVVSRRLLASVDGLPRYLVTNLDPDTWIWKVELWGIDTSGNHRLFDSASPDLGWGIDAAFISVSHDGKHVMLIPSDGCGGGNGVALTVNDDVISIVDTLEWQWWWAAYKEQGWWSQDSTRFYLGNSNWDNGPEYVEGYDFNTKTVSNYTFAFDDVVYHAVPVVWDGVVDESPEPEPEPPSEFEGDRFAVVFFDDYDDWNGIHINPKVNIYRAGTWDLDKSLDIPSSDCNGPCVSPDGKWLIAIFGSDDWVANYSPDDPRRLGYMDLDTGEITTIASGSDFEYSSNVPTVVWGHELYEALIYVRRNTEIRVYEIDGTLIRTLPRPASSMTHISVSPDGRYMAITASNGLTIYDLDINASELEIYKDTSSTMWRNARYCEWHPDGDRIAVIGTSLDSVTIPRVYRIDGSYDFVETGIYYSRFSNNAMRGITYNPYVTTGNLWVGTNLHTGSPDTLIQTSVQGDGFNNIDIPINRLSSPNVGYPSDSGDFLIFLNDGEYAVFCGHAWDWNEGDDTYAIVNAFKLDETGRMESIERTYYKGNYSNVVKVFKIPYVEEITNVR